MFHSQGTGKIWYKGWVFSWAKLHLGSKSNCKAYKNLQTEVSKINWLHYTNWNLT